MRSLHPLPCGRALVMSEHRRHGPLPTPMTFRRRVPQVCTRAPSTASRIPRTCTLPRRQASLLVAACAVSYETRSATEGLFTGSHRSSDVLLVSAIPSARFYESKDFRHAGRPRCGRTGGEAAAVRGDLGASSGLGRECVLPDAELRGLLHQREVTLTLDAQGRHIGTVAVSPVHWGRPQRAIAASAGGPFSSDNHVR